MKNKLVIITAVTLVAYNAHLLKADYANSIITLILVYLIAKIR